ncbi:hypothetical protein [Flavobacterium cerinum]|uniref:Uncharacterized protein n=1 Tax=Flavobacterium cerinum TaxID=2502784 RepID=A0A444HEH6_9FLAO|nr:hypothetical protein [Flavobacterium cerinum]RWX03376.1 hypothetical protein EPI11_00155 [Flavobacterium cerinum]
MSVKKHTYKEISTYLKTNVDGLEFVDKYRGQLDNVNNFVFPRPAVFISYGRFEYESLSAGNQQGKGIIRVRIVVENYADAFEGSFNQDAALDFFEINEKVHTALQGLSGTYFSGLNRLTDEDDEDHGNLIVTVMEYECNIIDDSAWSQKNFILTDPELKVEYINKEGFPQQIEESPPFVIPMK